jgi:hypothetical protein
MTFIQGTSQMTVKEYEAHHLLCVACVTEMLATKKELETILLQTEWCINAKANMLAMPLWGHTIKYYCDLESYADPVLKKRKRTLDSMLSNDTPPPFANIPQHDYDHNSQKGYTNEVKIELKKLAGKVANSKKKHEDIVKELQQELNDNSDHFRGELGRRGGSRCAGTHAAWQQGSKKPTSDWYEPFSMAQDGCAEPRTFPAPGFDSKVANKIQRLVDALTTFG